MKVHSIISNTISEEILLTGHLSIRFLADGFSLLLEDKNYRPVILNRFTDDSSPTKTSLVNSCFDWLNRHTLVENFAGEVTLVTDTLSTTLVPKDIFSKENARVYLEAVHPGPIHSVEYKKIKKRPFLIVYAVSKPYQSLAESFQNEAKIISGAEVMISMADQINASDHQRGFALIEVQDQILNILYIKKDRVELSNQLKINKAEDLLYYTLNTLQHLNFNQKKTALYYSGSIEKDILEKLRKYIRNMNPLSYFIQDIDSTSIPEHILLAEATKCE